MAGLTGLAPGVPASAAAAARTDAPFALRFQAEGWLDVRQAASAVLGCAGADACGVGTGTPATTVWLDVDGDPETINSSSATLPIPPHATVTWAGLYWSADRGAAAAGLPRCDNAPDGGPPATPAPAPDLADQVDVKINGDAYRPITAGSFAEVASPTGGVGYQAYADVTDLLRPLQAPTALTPVIITVADVQAAQGPACAGGWAIVLAYSFPDGADPSFAPTYRRLTVFDGIIPMPAGAVAQMRLDGLATPEKDPVEARLSAAMRGSGAGLTPETVTVNGVAVAPGATPAGTPTFGYTTGDPTIAAEAIKPGATSVTLGAYSSGNSYLAAVFAVTTRKAVTVDLALTSSIEPSSVAVGDPATITVSVRNKSTLPASGVIVTLKLATGLAVVDPPDGYDAVTNSWSVGRVPPGAITTLALGVRVTRPGRLDFSAAVTGADLPNPDSTPKAAASLTATSALSTTGAPTAEAALGASGGLPTILPTVLIGIGLFALGALMLFIVVLRNRAAA